MDFVIGGALVLFGVIVGAAIASINKKDNKNGN